MSMSQWASSSARPATGATRTTPLGVLEVTPEGTIFLPVRKNRELAKGLALGALLGLVLMRLLRR